MESDLGGAVVKDESSDFETILSVKRIKNSELFSLILELATWKVFS